MTALAALSTNAVADVASTATLVLPIGAVEQHGPHLPLGVDAFIVEHIANAAAERAERLTGETFLVAPVLFVGSSHHHLPLSGTLSVRSDHLAGVLIDVLDSAVRGGLRTVVIVNGHGGNEDVAGQVVRDAVLANEMTAAAVSYWTPSWERLCDEARRWGIGPLPGHAGAFETALMLHLRPELVDVSRAAEVSDPLPFSAVHPRSQPFVQVHRWVHRLGGRTDGPGKASAAAGGALMEVAVQGVADFLAELGSR